MLRSSAPKFAKTTPWRDLLHPITGKVRKSLWARRDVCEMNEEFLRRPYYSYVSDSAQDRAAAAAFRETMQKPTEAGPQIAEVAARATAFAQGSHLRPNYSESNVSLPPHHLSRTTTK